MCSENRHEHIKQKIGSLIPCWDQTGGQVTAIWRSHVRSETLEKVLAGLTYKMVDVPSDRFCERDKLTGQMVWFKVPAGSCIKGVVLETAHGPQLNVITRAISPRELEAASKTGHAGVNRRMPLLGPLMNKVMGEKK